MEQAFVQNRAHRINLNLSFQRNNAALNVALQSIPEILPGCTHMCICTNSYLFSLFFTPKQTQLKFCHRSN